MKLHTCHTNDFRLDDPTLKLDPTKGRLAAEFPYYLPALAKLQTLVGVKDFLWCLAEPSFIRTSASHDIVRWELEIPFAKLVAVCESEIWEKIIRDPDADWTGLLLKPTEQEAFARTGLTYLVRFPVENAKRFEMTPKHLRCKHGQLG